MWKSETNPMFRMPFSEDVFYEKYAEDRYDTWEKLAWRVVQDVCSIYMPYDQMVRLYELIRDMIFIPGGRYLRYAGKPNKFFNNCYLLRAEEDTREDWGYLHERAETCLMTGGGIGVDYSVYRASGSVLLHTGGIASGPLPAMYSTNEIGRNVMQGGNRRSAIYASLDRTHGDVWAFLKAKNWDEMEIVPGVTVRDAKAYNANYPAPLDMTNISVNYKTDWLAEVETEERGCFYTGDYTDEVFKENVRQALRTGEPGFSFNFFNKENETLRNACTEVTSEDDSDVCNLGSLNLARIETRALLKEATELATKFLLCGTLRAQLPYRKVHFVREKNRRLGLGLMGLHEWLLQRGLPYDDNDTLQEWLGTYRDYSSATAKSFSDELGISNPVACRAIAPTGTIGILAGTTTGIEPLFAVSYKRRYLKAGSEWHFQYVVDGTAQELINRYGLDPDGIETAGTLAANPERRIAFQATVQDYVDHAVSSTINLPAWGSEENNEDKVEGFARTLAKYAPRLRGLTVYPDGSRSGQPLTIVPYEEAVNQQGVEFREHDICSLSGKGGTCGV